MPESPPEVLAARFRPPFFGPNPYSPDPVVLAAVEFAPSAQSEGPARCAAIAELSRAWLAPPSLERCDTALGIAEFLARWTLAALNHRRGFLRAAGAFECDGEVVIALGFHHPRFSRQALELAFRLFSNVKRVEPAELDKELGKLWQLSHEQHHPDYQVTFLMRAAREMDVPFLPVVQIRKTWQFGWGARSELFIESEPGADSAIGDRLSRDKAVTKIFLRGLGVPTPVHVLAETADNLAPKAEAVGFPCIVKPLDGGRSVGVTTDIVHLAQLTAAVRTTLKNHGAPVMIESQVPGEVYRILVARGRVACVVRRAAPHVVGDGKRTVRALIAAQNQARERSAMDFIGDIPLDDECAAALKREGVGPDDVLEKGRTLPLRRIPLLSSGAVYTDVTAETHPDTCRMAELIAASLGIEACGIDFITSDITRPMNELGAVLEANTMPGLRVPMVAGLDPVAIGRQVLGERPARIPAALLVAPAARLADVREASRFAETTGWAIGRTAGVGALELKPQPHFLAPADVEPTIQQCATLVVRNPFVERIFITALIEDVVEAGLPLDRFDTVVCLDCKPDTAWERVLREASGSYAKAKSLDEALRKCGMAKPTPPRAAPRRRRDRRSRGG